MVRCLKVEGPTPPGCGRELQCFQSRIDPFAGDFRVAADSEYAENPPAERLAHLRLQGDLCRVLNKQDSCHIANLLDRNIREVSPH